MPFTKEEFEAWHQAKQKRELKPTPLYRPVPIATCMHCHNPFGINEGFVFEGIAICDVCDED